MNIPDVISSTECLAIADETGAIFIEEDSALDALETGGVPFEIRCYTEDVLILNGRSASDAQTARCCGIIADASDADATDV